MQDGSKIRFWYDVLLGVCGWFWMGFLCFFPFWCSFYILPVYLRGHYTLNDIYNYLIRFSYDVLCEDQTLTKLSQCSLVLLGIRRPW
jgi:hypothetical protein